MSKQQHVLRQCYSSLLADITSSAINISDTNQFIEESLERVGKSLRADSVFLYACDESGLCDAPCMWRASGGGR